MVGTIDHLKSNLDDNAELYEMSKADEAFDDLAAIEADAAELRKTVEQAWSSAACSATRPTR